MGRNENASEPQNSRQRSRLELPKSIRNHFGNSQTHVMISALRNSSRRRQGAFLLFKAAPYCADRLRLAKARTDTLPTHLLSSTCRLPFSVGLQSTHSKLLANSLEKHRGYTLFVPFRNQPIQPDRRPLYPRSLPRSRDLNSARPRTNPFPAIVAWTVCRPHVAVKFKLKCNEMKLPSPPRRKQRRRKQNTDDRHNATNSPVPGPPKRDADLRRSSLQRHDHLRRIAIVLWRNPRAIHLDAPGRIVQHAQRNPHWRSRSDA